MKKTDPDSSRGEWAYGRLKMEIANGTMEPGSRVRENEIAERLGISRTPVREALRRLEAEDLIVHVPHQGAIIAELDHQAVIELYDMRETLEGTAARYAARHASEAEIQDLVELVESEQENVGDFKALAQLNRAFHGALYRAGHNRYLLKALLSLSDAMILLGGTTLAVPDRFPAAHAEHQDDREGDSRARSRSGGGCGAQPYPQRPARPAQAPPRPSRQRLHGIGRSRRILIQAPSAAPTP